VFNTNILILFYLYFLLVFSDMYSVSMQIEIKKVSDMSKNQGKALLSFKYIKITLDSCDHEI